MRRYVSLWLPRWPTDRWRRRQAEPLSAPLALVGRGKGGLHLTAVDAAAAGQGLSPGMTLTNARALVPGLKAADADTAADAHALGQLADWCGRYTPWTAVDGEDGVILDITGCAHLFGGEAALVQDLRRRVEGLGFEARAAAADTPAAAWAWAHDGNSPAIPVGHAAEALGSLPAASLRLTSEDNAALDRLGLRHVADLIDLPRTPLAARFGEVLFRLDKALGRIADPISPRHPPPAWRSRFAFAEAISRREDLDEATGRLIVSLCGQLEQGQCGARRLDLVLFRVDGTAQRLSVGTSRPMRAKAHLARLFAERLGEVDPGFGIEVMALEARSIEPLAARQLGLLHSEDNGQDGLAELVDRLRNRLGRRSVMQLVPVDSYIPERATNLKPALVRAAKGRAAWPARPPRPLRLLPYPEPIEVTAEVPDGPPILFRWRRVAYRVAHADGPERIAPEWWRDESGRTRDYYRVEAEDGRRFWLYRDGLFGETAAPRWYLHGLFG